METRMLAILMTMTEGMEEGGSLKCVIPLTPRHPSFFSIPSSSTQAPAKKRERERVKYQQREDF
jgi:hypothetical protein